MKWNKTSLKGLVIVRLSLFDIRTSIYEKQFCYVTDWRDVKAKVILYRQPIHIVAKYKATTTHLAPSLIFML